MNGTDFLCSPAATSPPETDISAFGGALYVISNSLQFLRISRYFSFHDIAVRFGKNRAIFLHALVLVPKIFTFLSNTSISSRSN